MIEINIERATEKDIDILAKFNKRLIEDEKHNNQMNVEQLKNRMKDFIFGEYNAFIFSNGSQCIGYALVNMTKEPLYLRQFYIDREFRRQGYGRQAFLLLMNYINCKEIDIEVLEWNERGREFWKSIGFKTRSLYMRFEELDSNSE